MAKKDSVGTLKKPNRYSAIIGTIFRNHYKPGGTQFEFSRDEFVEIARSLDIALPKNLGRELRPIVAPAFALCLLPNAPPSPEC